MTTIDTQLAELAEVQRRHAALLGVHAAERESAIPRLVHARLAQIDAVYAPQLAALALAVCARTTEVKAAVLEHGHSVKGHGLQAVYVPGRPAWDDAGLQGFALAEPRLLGFRTVGAPSVTLRKAEVEAPPLVV